MTGQLYALYTPCTDGIEQCAARCKRRLTELFESGVNYDGFTYPYFDSVLMSDAFERFGLPFGTHTLLWDGDGRLEGTDAKPIGFDFCAINGFLMRDLYQPVGEELLIGGYELVISGALQPWALREHSRKFCSFCEHIARMDVVKLKGLTGGYVVAEVSGDDTLEKVKDIFNAKTGGICRVLRSGAADLEEI